MPPFQTERASFDALRFRAQWFETALLHRDPAKALRSLVAQRLPFVNIPQVRVCDAVSVHHAWQTFTVSPHYNEAFGYYVASALPPAHWHFRVLRCRERGVGVPHLQHNRQTATRSCLLYAGCLGDNAYQRADLISPAPSRFGSGVSQPLSSHRHHDASDRGSSRQPRCLFHKYITSHKAWSWRKARPTEKGLGL